MNQVRYKLLVGVTGSPGCGKTTVCDLLRDKGVLVIDVDQAGRWVVEHSAALRLRLRATFGDDYFFADGSLDRKKLSTLVFANHDELLKLNRIVHPFMINRVRQQMLAAMQDKRSLPYLVIDMALLFELHLNMEMDFVVTVTAPQEMRLQRLMSRHGVSPQQAEQMTNAQLPQEIKAARADYVLANDDNILQLQLRVDTLHKELLNKSNLSDSH
ncbi:MAG TPA: dephospho-CoA kinase [bacterium]|nr:dephospho-CoA kinase [bacterium]HPN42258.1 dephospho-CoA kinase [bacterium]